MKERSLLRLEKVKKSFGGVNAVWGLSLEVRFGPVYGLIGPNGAGKTTVFNLVTGVFPCTDGSLFLEDTVLNHLKPYHRARLGISRTFQTIRLFPSMTTWENVLMGQNYLSRSGVTGILPIRRQEEKGLRKKVGEVLSLLGLWEMKDRKAMTLPYGSQRKVEIARAIVAEPKLLLLDEPTAGMNARETGDILNVFTKIHELGTTMVVIEHDMSLVMGICDHIFVLNFGQKIAEGTPKEIRANEAVLEAYLGKEE